ncbi:MAG: chromosome segregation protein SMC [Clostridiales bacterium]|nr:chromosome segregation protein SMC [Clostridiales bacterium]
MRLKSLELCGFKSFPDKTQLTFSGGITAVVGPNGSGKSNISDAIRWVLGELSSKNLRGTKMEDIIFGGTDTRRPSGMAEVSLVIDNTDEENRLDIDYDEVTITRRYFRTGESEYLINRKPVRLRDISELFMNTGVGKYGYSIIGQGRIAEIISQRSEDRRAVFEEAAGISKYKYKKNEAERKLAEVDENLIRVHDLLAQLGERLGPLEKEAERARKYLELYEQKKATDVALWLYDMRVARAKLVELERGRAAAQAALDEADAALAKLDEQSDSLYVESQKKRSDAERASTRIAEYTEQLHSKRTKRMLLENDITHIDSQIEQIEADRKIKASALASAEENYKAQKAEAERLSALYEAELAKLKEAEAELAEHTARAETLKEELAALSAESERLSSDSVELRIKLSSLGDAAHEQEQQNPYEEELGKLKESVDLLSQRMAKAEAAISDYADKLSRENTALQAAQKQTESYTAELEAAKDKHNRLRVDISALLRQADALRRMEELFEGYNGSVRRVMEAAAAGELRGVLGPISQLIRTEPKYNIAIETALGASIQHIVVEDEEAAKAAIAYLKRVNGGRATFYPLTSVKGRQNGIPKDMLSGRRGFVGAADELVDCDERYRGVIRYLLARTAVFRSIDDATEAARAFGYRFRIVTVDGQTINAGGSFTGGSVKRDSGMLSRSADISKLEEQAAKIEVKAAAERKLVEELTAKIEKQKQICADINGKVNLLNTLYQAEKTQLEVLRAQHASDKKRLEEVLAEYRAFSERLEEAENQRAEIKARLDKINGRLAGIAAEIDEKNRLRAECVALRDAARARHSELTVSATASGRDADAAKRSEAFALDTVTSLREQLERAEAAVYSLNEKKIAAQNEIEQGIFECEQLADDIEMLTRQRNQLEREATQLDSRLAGLREELREQTKRREVFFREFTKADSAFSQLQAEIDRETSRIWDDYELTYSTAVAAAEKGGYPVVTEENRAEIAALQTECKNKIRALGPVNVGAIEEYAEIKKRYESGKTQADDLAASRQSLTEVIQRLEREMRIQFMQAFEEINLHFGRVFGELFGGGTAEITLTDPDDVLTSGIEINVAPPGKIIKNLMALSGGEQAYVAIALIFAILCVNPTPFCVFDEIEAALDDVNVARFAEYLKRYSENIQFIVITHRRGTMECASTLYGVTMPERGISRVLGLNIDEIESKIGIKQQ